MKRIVALFLLAFALLPVHVTAENEIDPKDCIPFPADCKKADVAMAALCMPLMSPTPKITNGVQIRKICISRKTEFFRSWVKKVH